MCRSPLKRSLPWLGICARDLRSWRPHAGACVCERGGFWSNRVMEAPHNDIEQRLIDLETKLSFSEDLVDQLNQTVFRQQQQIDLLAREVALLRQQAPEGGAGMARNLRDDLPPHY